MRGTCMRHESIKTEQSAVFQVPASLRSDAENSNVLLILVLGMHEVISPEILMVSSQVPTSKHSISRSLKTSAKGQKWRKHVLQNSTFLA